MERTEIIGVRVSVAEKRKILREAHKDKRSVSDYIRLRLFARHNIDIDDIKRVLDNSPLPYRNNK